MKKVILAFCVVFLFNACKKIENLDNQNTANGYSGIKNVEEFDKVINELNSSKKTDRLGNPKSISIKLSDQSISEMRNSIVFDNNKIRGFNECRLMQNELSIEQQIYLYQKLAGANVTLLDANEKLIATSPSDPTAFTERTIIIIKDHRPRPNNDCSPYFDAECWTYWNY